MHVNKARAISVYVMLNKIYVLCYYQDLKVNKIHTTVACKLLLPDVI